MPRTDRNAPQLPPDAVATLPPSQLSELLRALQAVEDGNFAVRLPGDWTGIEGKIADTFNRIVASNARIAGELIRSEVWCDPRLDAPATRAERDDRFSGSPQDRQRLGALKRKSAFGKVVPIAWRLDTNAFGPHSATPYLDAEHDGKGPRVLVSAVVLSGDTVWPRQLAESIEVTVDGFHVTVRFADGTRAGVQLGEEVGDGGGTAPDTGAPA